jgi:hypothetical protein
MVKVATTTVILLLGLVLVAEARQLVPEVRRLAPALEASSVAAAVPFGPGERAVYRVTYGILGKRGQAVAEVTGVEEVRGRDAYTLSFRLRGGVLGMNVNDHQESWLDVNSCTRTVSGRTCTRSATSGCVRWISSRLSGVAPSGERRDRPAGDGPAAGRCVVPVLVADAAAGSRPHVRVPPLLQGRGQPGHHPGAATGDG